MVLRAPLQARSYPVNGIEHLEIWCNGKKEVVPAPISPYFYTKRGLQLDLGDRQHELKQEQVDVRLISTLETVTAWKHTFPQVQFIRKFNDQVKHQPEDYDISMDNHIPFIERVAMDKPEFFSQYEEKMESELIFDIETLTKNHHMSKQIISISVGTDLENIWCHYDSDGRGERGILEKFIQDWKKIDPDVVVGFNSKNFDLPIIIDRCKFHGLAIDWVQRGTDMPPKEEDGRIHRIQGRVMFDVFEQVMADQTLTGIKRRGLKQVAQWHKIPVIEEEVWNTVELQADPERLVKYNNSDVYATTRLYEIYKHQLIIIANFLNFPYDLIVNPPGAKGLKKSKSGRANEGITSLLARLIVGRGFKETGFVTEGPNWRRYPKVFQVGDVSYQGAVVDLNKTGVFGPVLHVDFSGMYPSLQMSFNISPETVKLLGYEEYDVTAEVFREATDDYIIFCIPDEKLFESGANCIIYVDLTFEGCVPRALHALKDERDPIKARKAAAEEIGDKLTMVVCQSQQYGLKVTGNSCGYGSNALDQFRHGSIILAILITGLGRYFLKFALAWLNQRGLEHIELDTDGIWVDWTGHHSLDEGEEALNAAGKVIEVAINQIIQTEVLKYARESVLEMDKTVYRAMYSYKAKSYCYQKLDGDILFKGGAFKSQSKPKMYDAIRDTMAEMKLRGAPEDEVTRAVKLAMAIEQYDVRELSMTMKIGMHPSKYDGTPLGKKLAMLGWYMMGIEGEAHNTYSYLYRRKNADPPVAYDLEGEMKDGWEVVDENCKGYMLTPVANLDEVDYPRYRVMIAKLATRFGYGDIASQFVKRVGINPLEVWH